MLSPLYALLHNAQTLTYNTCDRKLPAGCGFSAANLNGYPWRVQPIWHLHLVWLVFYNLADERRNKSVHATAKKGGIYENQSGRGGIWPYRQNRALLRQYRACLSDH